jgi:PTH2 family peptidyl-tRNA hydrolase
MTDVKQCIMIRNDLNLRKGKMVAQGAHVSLMFLQERVQGGVASPLADGSVQYDGITLTPDEINWLANGHAKVVLQVNSEDELRSIHQQALAAGLTSYLVVDSGRTEFHGVATATAVCIGPNQSEEINKITAHLKLW